MILKSINLTVPNEHVADPSIDVTLSRISEPVYNKTSDTIALAVKPEPSPNSKPVFSILNLDAFYLLLDGSVLVKKKNESNRIISSGHYSSSEFVNYSNEFDGLYNQSIQLMMQENAKLLSFEIQDETFPPLSVKALTISNSSVNINTKNDSIVIIVGSHRTSGSGHDSDTHMCHYRIGGPEDTANTIAPGFMTVSTSNTCHVVCVEKI